MEVIAKNVSVYGKYAIGPKRHNKDIIHDIFLTQEQAMDLLEQLSKKIEANTKGK